MTLVERQSHRSASHASRVPLCGGRVTSALSTAAAQAPTAPVTGCSAFIFIHLAVRGMRAHAATSAERAFGEETAQNRAVYGTGVMPQRC